ncbi:MAG: phospholipase [Methanospirillum sp.]|nr:phospholipase [Methanospirillum sp.]
MRVGALLVLVFALLADGASAYVLAEVCPDTWIPGDDDEFFVLEGTAPLGSVSVTDGEGTARFPPGAAGDGRVVVALNGSAYALVHGELPDFELLPSSPAPEMLREGELRLGNRGDGLTVLVGGRVTDWVEWPGDVVMRRGQVHYREEGRWDPRVLMIGQSRFDPLTATNVSGTVFLSPDCGSGVLADLVARASGSVLLGVYELTDPVLADALVSARDRGVSVTVLAQGSPVGGIPSGEWAVLPRLLEAGAGVYFMSTRGTAHARYRHLHGKYLVVDGRWTLVTTENWKPAGFPPAGRRGNRGWGVLLDDPRIAGYFSAVFADDLEGRDVGPVGTLLPGGIETPDEGAYAPRSTPAPFSGATVTTVLAPDTADEIAALIRGAERSIAIEQAYIANESGDRLQRYLSEAVEAARRGVEVRILLDSAWFNTEDEADNDEQAALINRIAAAEGLPLEARLLDLDAHGLVKVHTKGVVVDRRRVLVSSINWNEASPSFNRETGVIIDEPGVGAYFADAFDRDWAAGGGVPAPVRGVDWFRIAVAALVIVGMALGVRRKKNGR